MSTQQASELLKVAGRAPDEYRNGDVVISATIPASCRYITARLIVTPV